MLKRKEYLKKFILINMIIIFIFIFAFICFFHIKQQDEKQMINYYVKELVNIMKENNPQLNEVDVIKIINKKQSNKREENWLEDYGITDDMMILRELQEKQKRNMISCCIILFLLGIILNMSFILYVWKKDKKLKELTNYLENLNRKNYFLDIEDNGEGELSALKNEIYKITVTLKEQAENSLKEQKALSDSVSDISHQLKTPLTSMMIMLDNLKDNQDMPIDIQKDFIDEITSQVEWIHFLVVTLLKLARFDAGVIVLQEEKINIKKLVEESVKNVSILMDIKNQEIKISGDDSFIVGDFHWQKEALTNILKNCVEHSPEHSTIEIHLKSNAVYNQIIIKDHGVGMDQEDLKNIFKRFYKGKNSSKQSIGIGLALAKTIIEKGNGYIICHSIKNKGTTFEIRYMK